MYITILYTIYTLIYTYTIHTIGNITNEDTHDIKEQHGTRLSSRGSSPRSGREGEGENDGVGDLVNKNIWQVWHNAVYVV